MQEEITQGAVTLSVETGKLTAQLLQQAMKKVLADMEKHKNDPQLRHGKQTLRQLMKHGAGVSNIEITDQNIKAFSAIRHDLVFSEYGRDKVNDKLEFCEGEVSMKKIGLGIAILLFAIIISLCSSGMGLLVIGIGIVGLIFSIIGFIENK